MESVFSTQVSDLTPEQLNAAVAGAIAVGTLYCFLGYRTSKFVIGLTGFLLAGAVAALIVAWLTHGHLISVALAALIGGVSGAMALFFLYRTGIFILGLLGAGLLASNVLSGMSEPWVPAAVLGAGLAGGLFALIAERPALTVATSAIGAWMVVAGMAYFLWGSDWFGDIGVKADPEYDPWLVLTAWAVLALLGLFAQLATHKPSRPAKPA